MLLAPNRFEAGLGASFAAWPNILDAVGLDESAAGAPAGVVEAKENIGFAGVPCDDPAFNPENKPPAGAGAELVAGWAPPNRPPPEDDGNALVVGVDV